MNSLIATILNEKAGLDEFLKSIQGQSMPPDEIVIVDGGSTDGSWEFLQEKESELKNLKVFRESGNIAHGRNFAIRKSSGQLIVVADAGCRYDKDWFKKITAPFEDKSVTWAATGFGPWLEKNDNFNTLEIAAATIPQKNEFNKLWLPSSRSVAFYKDRWQTAGGYPEWIPYCEDVLFDLKLVRKEGQPFFVREVLVHWRPRTSLGKYFRQLFNYTRSEGHAHLNTHRNYARFAAYIALVACLFYRTTQTYYLLPILAGGAVIYMLKYWQRFRSFSLERSVLIRYGGLVVLPLYIFYGDLAKMLGYLYGSAERALGTISENN